MRPLIFVQTHLRRGRRVRPGTFSAQRKVHNLPSLLYLASSNSAKLREFREGAKDYGVSVKTLPGMCKLPACVENGRTFEENARKKARHFSKFVDGLVFADDSGISVEALGGAPGIYSARFAGLRATDRANNRKLLEELSRAQSKPSNPRARSLGSVNRLVRYVCVIGLAERGRILTAVEGRARGLILDQPRGRGGFGYDPLFYYPPLGKTFAEMTPAQKFTVSHRGRAFRKLMRFLGRLQARA